MISLCIDIGNTDICAGVFTRGQVEQHTRCSSSVSAKEFFDGAPSFDFDRAIVASVVPSVTESWMREISNRFSVEALLCSYKVASDLIKTNVDNPMLIGADRIADAVAALHIYGNNCIVIDFGTATNIEYIDEQGVFQGGIFAPGLWSGMKGLEHAAAKLPRVRIERPNTLLGKNTHDAIRSGLIFGEGCRVDGLVELIIEKYKPLTRPKVIATGGFSSLMVDVCKTPTVHDKLLTLRGLEIIIESGFSRKCI